MFASTYCYQWSPWRSGHIFHTALSLNSSAFVLLYHTENFHSSTPPLTTLVTICFLGSP